MQENGHQKGHMIDHEDDARQAGQVHDRCCIQREFTLTVGTFLTL
jgi:hypothetical protein